MEKNLFFFVCQPHDSIDLTASEIRIANYEIEAGIILNYRR